MRVMTRRVDQVFSFGSSGQGVRDVEIPHEVLEKNGFKVERSYAGIPTAVRDVDRASR